MQEVIELPWPAKNLSPNARCHWSAKARAVKQARQDGYLAARMAGYTAMTFDSYEGRLHLWITGYCPTRRYIDDDNLLASIKPYRDGIADLLKVNDRRFVAHPLVSDETVKGGKVVIKITQDVDAK